MIPRLHEEPEITEMWRHEQDADESMDSRLDQRVIQTLTDVFRREEYGYHLYVDTALSLEDYVSVLGRVVRPEDTLSNPVSDRLILPGAPSA
jgi:hypothetical protein